MDLHAVPINEYLKGTSQQRLADALGLSQAAIHKMTRRNVFVGKKLDGTLYAYEVREIRSRGDKAA